MIGGNAGLKARLADVLIENVPQEDVLPLVDKVVTYYKENGKSHERLGTMIQRLGLETVQQAVLA